MGAANPRIHIVNADRRKKLQSKRRITAVIRHFGHILLRVSYNEAISGGSPPSGTKINAAEFKQ